MLTFPWSGLQNGKQTWNTTASGVSPLCIYSRSCFGQDIARVMCLCMTHTGHWLMIHITHLTNPPQSVVLQKLNSILFQVEQSDIGGRALLSRACFWWPAGRSLSQSVTVLIPLHCHFPSIHQMPSGFPSFPSFPHHLTAPPIFTSVPTSHICSAAAWPSSPTSSPVSHSLIGDSLQIPIHFHCSLARSSKTVTNPKVNMRLFFFSAGCGWAGRTSLRQISELHTYYVANYIYLKF